MGGTDFPDQFRNIIIRHKRNDCDLNVMRQSACLLINPIMVDNLNCTLVNLASDPLKARN